MWSTSTTATSYSRNMVERVLQSVASTLPHNTRGTPHATGVLARTAGGREARFMGRPVRHCATVGRVSNGTAVGHSRPTVTVLSVFVRSFVRLKFGGLSLIVRSPTHTHTHNTQPVVVSVDSMSWYYYSSSTYRTQRRRHDRRVDWCGSAMHLPAWAERARVGDGD